MTGPSRNIPDTNSSNLNTNSYRNGTSASTTIANSVSVTVTVQDTDGNPIEGAKVLLEETPGGADVISYGITDVNGQVSATFSGTACPNQSDTNPAAVPIGPFCYSCALT